MSPLHRYRPGSMGLPKFWETVGLGKEERKEFEKNITSNFINCIIFSARKNKVDVNTFIDEAKKEYDFDLII